MKLLTQLCILFAICLASEGIARILPFPLPSSVIAMLLLFLLLASRLVRPAHIEDAADFLLKNMGFFFIPAGVGIMERAGVLQGSILPLLLICFLTMVLTFAATAWTVKLVTRLQERMGGKGHE